MESIWFTLNTTVDYGHAAGDLRERFWSISRTVLFVSLSHGC